MRQRFLPHAGKSVVVLEQHYTAGGYTHAFERPGYEWDVGVEYVGSMTSSQSFLRAVFHDVSEGAVEWADMGSVYDTLVFGEERYEIRAGRESYRSDLRRWFPREQSGIDRYFELVERTSRGSQLHFAAMALPRRAERSQGGGASPVAKAIESRTLETLRELTSDARLIGVLTGRWGDFGLSPAKSSFLMHASLVSHYMDGGAYPIGGSARVAEAIERVIVSRGGSVVTNAAVESILIQAGRAVGSG